MENFAMRAVTRLPLRYPDGAKYILESHGLFVRRFVEFPDGRRTELDPRKAQTCRRRAEPDIADAAKRPDPAAA
jgi:hypothetical protein